MIGLPRRIKPKQPGAFTKHKEGKGNHTVLVGNLSLGVWAMWSDTAEVDQVKEKKQDMG